MFHKFYGHLPHTVVFHALLWFGLGTFVLFSETLDLMLGLEIVVSQMG